MLVLSSWDNIRCQDPWNLEHLGRAAPFLQLIQSINIYCMRASYVRNTVSAWDKQWTATRGACRPAATATLADRGHLASVIGAAAPGLRTAQSPGEASSWGSGKASRTEFKSKFYSFTGCGASNHFVNFWKPAVAYQKRGNKNNTYFK